MDTATTPQNRIYSVSFHVKPGRKVHTFWFTDRAMAATFLESVKKYEEAGKQVRPPRAFVNIVDDDSRKAQYMNVSDALSNEETRYAVLGRAMRELKSFQDKYSALSELAEVFAAIDNVKI